MKIKIREGLEIGDGFIPITRGQHTIVSRQDYQWLIQYKWHAGKDSSGIMYACTWIRIGSKRIQVRMHRMILEKLHGTKYLIGLQVDHINRNSLDNRRENLKRCTQSENLLNKNGYRNNTSGSKGIYWDSGTGKWRASIRIDKRLKYLGIYTEFSEAQRAYDMEKSQCR